MESKPSPKKSSPRKQQLGELLVEYGLINDKQLQSALRRQTQVGGQLGSILIDMGFISVDDLLSFLSKQLGVPSANLFKLDIDKEVLKLLPLNKINALKVLPIAIDGNTLRLAMVAPHDFSTVSEIEFTLGKKVQPVVVPSFMMEAAAKSLMKGKTDGIRGQLLEQVAIEEKEKVGKAPALVFLLRQLVQSGASDMLLTAGAPPSLKLANHVVRLAHSTLTPEDCERYARDFLPDRDWEDFLQNKDKDFAVTYPDIGRFRVSFYRQRNSVSIALRSLPERLPSLKELQLPEFIREFVLKPQGMILICGPAGHGKSTTLCAMIDIINNSRRCNIVTLEDPVEYLHSHKKSNINQREVGRDTQTFEKGLKAIFRQAPDVIVIGEMRDKESFEIALHAAHTGHLVLSTVHADNSTSIIERVVNMFPPHQQALIRIMLSDSLLLILSQRLVPTKDGKKRVMALEKLVNTFRIKNLLREGKAHQIRSQMQAGTDDFEPIDLSLAKLYNQGLISFDDGLVYAENEPLFGELTGMIRA